MGTFFGNIGNAIKGAATTAVGVSPYVKHIVDERDAKARQDALQKIAQDRQAAQDKIAAALAEANIGHIRALTRAADDGQWGTAFAATDDDGNPVMVQQHKQTGELRRAVIGNGGVPGVRVTPTASAAPGAGGESRGMASPEPDLNGMPTEPQPQSVAQAPASPPSPAPQAPKSVTPASRSPQQAQGTTTQGTAPTPLRPYVKPTVSAIPYRLTPAGIAADSTAAAKKAQAEAPYKKDPNASPTPTYTPFQGTDAAGNPVVRPFNTKTGQFGPVADVAPKLPAGALGPGSAPMAAKVGQAGEMLKKAGDILPLMEQLGVSLGQSSSADIAQNGVGIGHARIPGTKGLGNLMVNQTPTYAQYQATLSPFVLAAAHALSGARINQDQVNQIRQSIELAPGDIKNPQVIAQKRKNLVDLVNSITGSLPQDAIGAQEGQIDPTALAMLEGHGYKRSGTRPAPSARGRGAPPANAQSAGRGRGDVPGDINLGTPSAVKKAPVKDYGIFTPPGDDE